MFLETVIVDGRFCPRFQLLATSSRMLKQSASSVLSIVQTLNGPKDFRRSESLEELFPFAKTYSRGERPTRVGSVPPRPFTLLRPWLGQGASLDEKAVLADSGRRVK